ncbi:hypothetical protein [Maribellus mangrovi]|uniref:hypothetical protein n=1 Tax=Maribellus mangrovi TaxID=3133146 RepID=UPI0030EC5DAB
MDTENNIIAKDAKCLAERVSGLTYKLFFWRNSFYEVSYTYGSDDIKRIEHLENESTLNLYIEAMHHTGEPDTCERDQDENLNKTGKIIARILKEDHLDFYLKLLWDQKLHWYCNMLEVRAAYLIDEIKTAEIKIIEARDIAIRELLKGDPERHIKPPYIKTSEGGIMIQYPRWTYNRKSMANFIIEDDFLYGNGINDVLGRVHSFGGYEDATVQEYWDEQSRLIEEIKRKRGIA